LCGVLIAQDVHPKTIEHRLGHSGITVTLDRDEQLFAALDDALTGALDATYCAADKDNGEGEGSSDHRLGRAIP
jgi:hypothetical protein